MRIMDSFEILKAVWCGAKLKNKKTNEVTTYWITSYDPKDYLICYDGKQLLWQECEVEGEK